MATTLNEIELQRAAKELMRPVKQDATKFREFYTQANFPVNVWGIFCDNLKEVRVVGMSGDPDTGRKWVYFEYLDYPEGAPPCIAPIDRFHLTKEEAESELAFIESGN